MLYLFLLSWNVFSPTPFLVTPILIAMIATCQFLCIKCCLWLQHYACRSGHVEICQLLLSSGASANSQTPGGVTPLHRAAYCGHVEVVRVLLQHAADVELVDSDGRTALHKVNM